MVFASPKILLGQLDKALAAVEMPFAAFLRSGPDAGRVEARALAYIKSLDPKVRARAQALVSQARGLRSSFESLQRSSGDLLARARTLRAEVTVDPVLAPIMESGGEMAMTGWATAAAIKTKLGLIKKTTDDLWGMKRRVVSHIQEIVKLADGLKSIENFAQGKGFATVLERVGSGIGSTYSSAIKILAIGVVAYFLLPSLLVKSAARRVRA